MELVLTVALVGLLIVFFLWRGGALQKQLADTHLQAELWQMRAVVAENYVRVTDNETEVVLGPHLFEKGVPKDPILGSNRVLVVTGNSIEDADFTNTGGWIFNPLTLEVRANVPGRHDF